MLNASIENQPLQLTVLLPDFSKSSKYLLIIGNIQNKLISSLQQFLKMQVATFQQVFILDMQQDGGSCFSDCIRHRHLSPRQDPLIRKIWFSSKNNFGIRNLSNFQKYFFRCSSNSSDHCLLKLLLVVLSSHEPSRPFSIKLLRSSILHPKASTIIRWHLIGFTR